MNFVFNEQTFYEERVLKNSLLLTLIFEITVRVTLSTCSMFINYNFMNVQFCFFKEL